MIKIEIYRDTRGEFRWRLRAANSEIVATSEGYTTRASARRSAEMLQHWASRATIADK